MCSPAPLRGRARARLRHAVVGVLAALLGLALAVPAAAQDPRLERAEARRDELQARLDEALQREHQLAAEVEQARAELADLVAREAEERRRADAARGRIAEQVRASYQFGATDPALTLIASDSPQEATEQARLLGVLAARTRGQLEAVAAARIRTEAAAAATQDAVSELAEREDELAAAREQAQTLVAQAERTVAGVREQIRREQAERERREREAAAARAAAARREQEAAASRSAAAAVPVAEDDDEEPAGGGGGGGGAAAPSAAAAPVSGGIACPVGSPRNYSDTWGAARSGGRAHKGTDILAPHGTPIYAYESGTITRLNNNGLGGISLYLRGDSGNVYYYTHLSGYNGVSVGQRVSAGQHIAHNGDTGNAAGIPHLHFEVSPGGGGNVNPFPYVQRACG